MENEMMDSMRSLTLLSLAFLFVLSSACGAPEEEPARDETYSAQERGTLPGDGGDGKSDTVQVAPGSYVSGIPPARFELLSMPDSWGRQHQSNWCWAATLQMILRFHGVLVNQEDIVLRAYGDYRDRPANSDEITRTVDNWQFMDAANNIWRVNAITQQEVTVTSVLEDLHYNQPVLVGLAAPPENTGAVGHAYVLSAISYRVDARGFVYPDTVQLRDPWPDNPSLVELPWSEFMERHMFYVRVRATLL